MSKAKLGEAKISKGTAQWGKTMQSEGIARKSKGMVKRSIAKAEQGQAGQRKSIARELHCRAMAKYCTALARQSIGSHSRAKAW